MCASDSPVGSQLTSGTCKTIVNADLLLVTYTRNLRSKVVPPCATLISNIEVSHHQSYLDVTSSGLKAGKSFNTILKIDKVGHKRNIPRVKIDEATQRTRSLTRYCVFFGLFEMETKIHRGRLNLDKLSRSPSSRRLSFWQLFAPYQSFQVANDTYESVSLVGGG